jgi:hypothetical protein
MQKPATEQPAGDDIPTIAGGQRGAPPSWALWERQLIDQMSQAAPIFVGRYTRSDGTFIWRPDWPGMDGSDDAYETFHTFPLLYLLGGGAELHRLARQEWDAITWQFTEYGQLHREFDAYYDWMHHGESYIYLYFLALADPHVLKDRQRAARFAGFYTGADPEAPNYDPEHNLIRSPINGSRGPRLEMSAEDWSTHRDVLRFFPAPFDDIPGAAGPIADWNDDATFRHILRMMNERMARGDIPLNMIATSLVAHAYLYTGDETYRAWVLRYLDGWRARARANGGILPDNVGLTGATGEYMGGKWWGGYYGWRWPHGALNLLEAATVAGMNAVLLTGDTDQLDLARSQLDLLWSLRREQDGRMVVPHKHFDHGWDDYRPMSPALPIQLWSISQQAEDLDRVLRLPDQGAWDRELTVRGVGWAPGAAWFRFVRGQFPDYPEAVLRATCEELYRLTELIRTDASEPARRYVQHWIDRNPVLCEALAQLMTGAPYPLYHGGLLHCRVTYYDPARRRPGLPEQVAALIDTIDEAGVRLQLVNLDPWAERSVILQAGAFAEHTFEEARTAGSDEPRTVGGPWLQVTLAPASTLALRLTMRRFANQPRYGFPWQPAGAPVEGIRLRTPEIDPGSIRFFGDELRY